MQDAPTPTSPLLSPIPSSEFLNETDSNTLSVLEKNPTLPKVISEDELPTRAKASLLSEEELPTRANAPVQLGLENLSDQETGDFIDPSKRYKIAKTLGTGGMGIVQSARDCLLGREVALKTIKTNAQKDQPLNNLQKMMLWRLSREASIMAILEHPNIVPLYDMQQSASGERSFTMRKIEGQTLNQLLKKMHSQELSYEADFLLSIFLKVCDAISYAHARGIIHRDLKPDNIMVGSFGEVYVLDWGIAKISQETDLDWIKDFSESTGKDLLVQDYHTIGGIGTPGYMAPEQAKGNATLQPQADIYALGRILRQCYVLLSPIEEIRKNIALQQNKGTASLWKVPKDIEAITRKATQEDYQNRYPSIQNFVEDIRCYRMGERISARKYGLGELFLRGILRYRKHLFVLTILLLLGMTSLGYFYQIRQKTQQLKRHQERLDYWFLRLSTGILEEDEREDAIFEISKMPEAEIFQQLLSKIQEGSEYFLQDQSRNSKQDEFYETLVTVLGRMEKPTAGPILLELLKKLTHRRVRYASVSDIEYMIALAQAIARSKTPQIAKSLQESRIKMGQNSLFWNRTKTIYRTLLQQESRPEQVVSSLAISDQLESAMSALYKEKYTEAIDLFSQALKLDPTLVFGYSNRGLAKLFLEDFDGAITDFTQSVQLNPKFFEGYLNRSEAYFRKKEWKSALADQTLALQIAPEMGWGYAMRATTKGFSGDFEGSINDFRQAISLSPPTPEIYFNRGLTYERMKEPDLAINDYAEAIRLNPGYYEAYNNRGLLKLSQKNFEDALYDFTKAIQINSQYATAYRNRGNTKREMGDLPGSIADLDVAIQLNPKSIENYLDRNYSKALKGDLHGGIADCHQILAIDPLNAWGYYYLGVAYTNLKDTEKSDLHFLKFLELSEKSTDPKTNAARKFIQQKYPYLKK
ncbi:MAG: tetratricopeptide repeat protein [Planctomycetota bacterium]